MPQDQPDPIDAYLQTMLTGMHPVVSPQGPSLSPQQVFDQNPTPAGGLGPAPAPTGASQAKQFASTYPQDLGRLEESKIAERFKTAPAAERWRIAEDPKTYENHTTPWLDGLASGTMTSGTTALHGIVDAIKTGQTPTQRFGGVARAVSGGAGALAPFVLPEAAVTKPLATALGMGGAAAGNSLARGAATKLGGNQDVQDIAGTAGQAIGGTAGGLLGTYPKEIGSFAAHLPTRILGSIGSALRGGMAAMPPTPATPPAPTPSAYGRLGILLGPSKPTNWPPAPFPTTPSVTTGTPPPNPPLVPPMNPPPPVLPNQPANPPLRPPLTPRPGIQTAPNFIPGNGQAAPTLGPGTTGPLAGLQAPVEAPTPQNAIARLLRLMTGQGGEVTGPQRGVGGGGQQGAPSVTMGPLELGPGRPQRLLGEPQEPTPGHPMGPGQQGRLRSAGYGHDTLNKLAGRTGMPAQLDDELVRNMRSQGVNMDKKMTVDEINAALKASEIFKNVNKGR